MGRITAEDLASWERSLAEEGDGEFLDPTLAQVLAPKLMEEVKVLQAELGRARRDLAAREAALLEERLTSASRSECRTCHDNVARAALSRLRQIASEG